MVYCLYSFQFRAGLQRMSLGTSKRSASAYQRKFAAPCTFAQFAQSREAHSTCFPGPAPLLGVEIVAVIWRWSGPCAHMRRLPFRLERRHHVDLRHQSSAVLIPNNGQQLAKNAGVRGILTTAMYVVAPWSDSACACTYRAPVAHEWFPRSLQQCSWAGPRAARMAPLPLHTKAWPAG
jgi:hypothetical protein